MSRVAASVTSMVLAFSMEGATARAQSAGEPGSYAPAQANPAAEAAPADYAQPGGESEGPPPPIPPFVDQAPVQAQGGGYCFEGSHPVDSRVAPGVTWDATSGRHVHPYPPFDLRLFNLRNGCYYFIGDPTDFGYAGESYNYYGAHPILDIYGGGWCFMIGPHRHFWRPWSPLFATVGPWFYWEGPYDAVFWTYWPYYHYYYRAHYPHYYAHGAFFRGHAVAPRIVSVPRPVRYGTAWHGAGGPMRAAPMGPRGLGAAVGPRGVAPAAPGYRPAPSVAPSGAARPAPMMAPRSAPVTAPRAAPSGGIAPRSFSAPRGGGGTHVGGRGRR